MLKKILFLLTLSLVTLSLVTFAKAAITNSSRVIPYQGRLTDSSGNNVADGTYSLTFKIYTVSTGGSASFTETNSSVSVSSGLFSVLLGSLSANGVNLDFANPPYYLGITVGANAEMSPRIQLGFAPLAHNSQYLDGTPLSSFMMKTGGSMTSDFALTGSYNLGIGTATPTTKIQASTDDSTANSVTNLLTLTHNTTGTALGATNFSPDTNSSLNTNLIAYWKFDETNGSRSDSFGSNTLTDNNTVTSATGRVGNAAQFTSANSEWLSITDNTALSSGTTDFSVSVWVYMDSKSTQQDFVAKARQSDPNRLTNREYMLTYAPGGDRFTFYVANSGGSLNGVTANNFGSPSINTWYHIVGTYNSSTQVSTIRVNNGTADTATGITPPLDTGQTFTIGASSNSSNSDATDYVNGRIDEVGFWKKVLSTQEITDLYNSGSGNTYGTAPMGIGSGILFQGEDAAGNTEDVGRISSSLRNVVNGSETSSITFETRSGGGALTKNMRLDGSGNLTLAGTLTQSGSPDIAENIMVTDGSIESGDVVMIDDKYIPLDTVNIYNRVAVKKSNAPYSSKLLGVISTNPGNLLNSSMDKVNLGERPLTLSGRVPVKIDPRSEPIFSGDFLTSSENPGFAKKATRSGYVIGRALENWKPGGEDKILVFVNFTFADIGDTIDQLRQIVCLDHPENKICL